MPRGEPRGGQGNPGRLIEVGLFALAVVCAFAGFGLPRFGFHYEPPDRGEALRIVTWNVGTAGGSGGDVEPGERLQSVYRTIALLDFSICVLQEVTEDELDWVTETYTLEADSVFVGGSGPGCAVIVKRGRLVELDVDDWRGRDPVNVLYRALDGRRVHLVGLHADPWSAVSRNLEIGRAVSLLESSDRRPTLRVLAGDLNLDIDIGGGKDLFTEDEYLDVQTYNYVAERFVDAAAGTGPTAEPDRRLDYVFLQADDAIEVDAGVWRGRRVGGMDHHPVVVDLIPKDR